MKERPLGSAFNESLFLYITYKWVLTLGIQVRKHHWHVTQSLPPSHQPSTGAVTWRHLIQVWRHSLDHWVTSSQCDVTNWASMTSSECDVIDWTCPPHFGFTTLRKNNFAMLSVCNRLQGGANNGSLIYDTCGKDLFTTNATEWNYLPYMKWRCFIHQLRFGGTKTAVNQHNILNNFLIPVHFIELLLFCYQKNLFLLILEKKT